MEKMTVILTVLQPLKMNYNIFLKIQPKTQKIGLFKKMIFHKCDIVQRLNLKNNKTIINKEKIIIMIIKLIFIWSRFC